MNDDRNNLKAENAEMSRILHSLISEFRDLAQNFEAFEARSRRAIKTFPSDLASVVEDDDCDNDRRTTEGGGRVSDERENEELRELVTHMVHGFGNISVEMGIVLKRFEPELVLHPLTAET